MQVIPADWQNKIEQHIVTMNTAMAYATEVGPGDEHARRWDLYTGTCDAFFDDLDTMFNSGDGFIDFMKSRVREAYRIAGHDDIPEGTWIDIAENTRTCHDAQNIASHYTHHYKGHLSLVMNEMKRHAGSKGATASSPHLVNG